MTHKRMCGLQIPLAAALANEPEDHMRAASAWTVGQIGRHTPDHAKAVADAGALQSLVQWENATDSSEDLRSKCKKSLKAIVAKLTDLPALDARVHRWAGSPSQHAWPNSL